MPQLLTLIKQGDRFTPTTYQFGASEHLNIRRQDQYADLTDAKTGAYIRQIGWDGLRDMGYAPAKLLSGNEHDQFIYKGASWIERCKSCAVQMLAGVGIAVAIAAVGVITGCAGLVLDQVEQDVATSTTAPRLTNQDAIKLAEFRRDAEHANNVLANAYGRTYE